MDSFKEFTIKASLVKALAKDQIIKPTSIQSEAIPIILENKDFIGEAITGSGKTLAYLLPSFERIDVTSKDLHTLIIAPTHELVVQISNVIKSLSTSSKSDLRSISIMGNVNIKRQLEALKTKPHIIIGTPGRILELIKLKKLKAHLIKTIVIDEADKMLSDENIATVQAIIKTTLKDRQLLAFSASIDELTLTRAKSLMKEPIVIRVNINNPNSDIEHMFIKSTRRDKITVLRKVIHATKLTKAIVFLNKNELISETCDRLNYHGIKAVAIFGNATKDERKKALDAFRTGSVNILVASDLVARGLDLATLSHIFNLDIPHDLNEYTHRSGRTGRAGNKGTTISIVTENEIQFINAIEKRNGIKIKEIFVSNGQLSEFQFPKSPSKKPKKTKKHKNR